MALVEALGAPAAYELLAATGARVAAALILAPPAACALTERFAGTTLDWQADGVMIRFPQLEIGGHLMPPDDQERDRQAWLRRIDRVPDRNLLTCRH